MAELVAPLATAAAGDGRVDPASMLDVQDATSPDEMTTSQNARQFRIIRPR
jgi:hypothetical protein